MEAGGSSMGAVGGAASTAGSAGAPVLSLSDLAGPACGGRTTRLDK